MNSKNREGGCVMSLVKIGVAGVLLIGIVGTIISFSKSGPPTPERRAELDKQTEVKTAYNAGKKYIETQLKAPATAQWSKYGPSDGTGAAEIEGKAGYYYAVGFVDSENSFGAKLRKSWRVEMIHDGDNWRFYKASLGDDTLLDIAPPK